MPRGQEFKWVVVAVSLSVVYVRPARHGHSHYHTCSSSFHGTTCAFQTNPVLQKSASQLSLLVSNDMQSGCQPTILMGVVEAGVPQQLKRRRKS